ncbi:hypothetical protein TWF718_009073 [Orbilia javanica]|uniref:Uncharacterized protein n=1 Tax=Orbilia javanica TaxID=47235 RepID=A0AAN8NSC1_9PEZI
MADLNDELRGILDDDESLGPFVDFNLGIGEQQVASSGHEASFFEEWNAGLSQFDMNPAILLPGVSELQASYDEPDAPHDLDCGPMFMPSPLFIQDSDHPLLPIDSGYQLYEQGRIYVESFPGQHSPNPNPALMDGNYVIDPHLENSGSSDYDGFQDLVGTVEAGAYILSGVDGDYGLIGMSSAAPIAPMGQLIPTESPALSMTMAGSNKNGKLVLKTGDTNSIDNFSPKISKSKAKGKAPVTGGRSKFRPMNRPVLAETSGNSAGSDLDEGIDLENISGIYKRSLSMPQAFAQSVGLGQQASMRSHVDENNFDSDETIDLEEYAAAYNASVGSTGDCLSQSNFPPSYGRERSTEIASGIKSDDSNLVHRTLKESMNGSTLTPSIPTKRGRGRPIVPGSKRQRRIQAMAQPDYVPPKRGRPRTNEDGQRKRVRRAKIIQPVVHSAFSPTPTYTPQPAMVQFIPRPPNQEVDDISFNQIYKPVILNNEIGYTPDQFILDPIQAGKIQQIYNVELPAGGWIETAERWRLTFNLNRITPTSESLCRYLDKMAEMVPITTSHDAGHEESIESSSGDTTKPKTGADIQPLTQVPVSPKEVEAAQKNIFPDQRLQIIAGDGTHHEMTHEQVLQKLLDERDVYFRAVVWELMQRSQRIGSMNFVGTWNRMGGVWEFT